MTLNPFFLQGSPNEQRLVQELINEQLKIYGIEVIYIPRKFVRKETILEEISSSKFSNNFVIEAYFNNYDGYSGQGDILSKFGVSLKDELSLIISRERFEDFIAPFLMLEDERDDNNVVLSSRPREGDLVYFPLGQKLFEVKFVEHEQPFYQLGRLYVYELKCELFEYEDEVIDTTIHEVDSQIQDEGYTTTLNLIGLGKTATASSQIGTGYIRKISLNNDGYGYRVPPNIVISPDPIGGIPATAEAITIFKSGVYSIKDIVLTNAGFGYTISPNIEIVGDGIGAAATCSIETTQFGLVSIEINDGGVGYSTSPYVTIVGDVGIGETAIVTSNIDSKTKSISSIKIKNPGIGYTIPPQIIIDSPSILTGTGNYLFNEVVTGSRSNTKARVKSWDLDTKILKVSLVDDASSKGFFPGESIVGSISGSIYSVDSFNTWDLYDKYSQNIEIQEEAEQFLDFSESNPFGNY